MKKLQATLDAVKQVAQVVAHAEPVAKALGVRNKMTLLKQRTMDEGQGAITLSYSKDFSPLRKHIQAAVSTGAHGRNSTDIFRVFSSVRFPVQDYLETRAVANQREIINQVQSIAVAANIAVSEGGNKPEATNTLNTATFNIQKLAIYEDHTDELLRFTDFEAYWEAWATTLLTERLHRYILSVIQPLNAAPPYPGAGSITNPNLLDLAMWVGDLFDRVSPRGYDRRVLFFAPQNSYALLNSLKSTTAEYLIDFSRSVSEAVAERGVLILPQDEYTTTPPTPARYFAFRAGDAILFVDDNITIKTYPVADATVETNRIRTVAELYAIVVPLRSINAPAAQMLVYGDTLANAFANM